MKKLFLLVSILLLLYFCNRDEQPEHQAEGPSFAVSTGPVKKVEIKKRSKTEAVPEKKVSTISSIKPKLSFQNGHIDRVKSAKLVEEKILSDRQERDIAFGQIYDNMMGPGSFPCCDTSFSDMKKDFNFKTGDYEVKTYHRQLGNGATEDTAQTWTRFIITIKRDSNNNVFPTKVNNRLDENDSDRVHIIRPDEQAKLKTSLESKSLLVPAIHQISAYFQGPMGLTDLGRTSLDQTAMEVSSICKNFKVVAQKWLVFQGNTTNKILSLLYCEKNDGKHQKISLVTLRKL